MYNCLISEKEHKTLQEREAYFGIARDWWVTTLVIIFCSIFIIALPILLWASDVGWVSKAIIALLLIFWVLYIIDLAFFSYYKVTKAGLVIGSQIKTLTVPYKAMLKIEPGNILALFSMGGLKRHALSANNLRIRLERAPWKVISVSPKDREGFIDAMLQFIEKEHAGRVSRRGKLAGR